MALTIPPSVNYPDLLTPVPALWSKKPIEGNKHIGGTINWGSMGGSGKTVTINVGGNAAQPVSQIAAITVDNSLSGSDVTFIFPDTGQTVPVPAYQAGTFPVFTTGTQFYISAPQALSVDRTSFVVHNAVPPHTNVPKTEFQNVAVAQSINLAAGTTQIVPATVTGTLSSLNIQINNSGAGSATLAIEDGTSAVLSSVTGANGTPNPYSQQLLNLTNLSVRFQGGLKGVVIISGTPAGSFVVNAMYRTP